MNTLIKLGSLGVMTIAAMGQAQAVDNGVGAGRNQVGGAGRGVRRSVHSQGKNECGTLAYAAPKRWFRVS